ncbi:rod shape-determining protein MreC [Parvularcula dongshanensis]|uniref:Cell shape-determining protein MreC n=1 Tax=Parvularcula dongshanensis TaxID=1173995 RepID=A0A840I5I0_9PROT|nr:rod shape-determining protein MreC [Parvularcula dongshanensis]MBB4659533.1 rod shape-determining protein MreC [Parvularcula dongshanensis]
MTSLGYAKRDGLRRREERRYGLIFLTALSFFMVLFSLYGAQASVFEKARESVLDTFAPVLSVVGAPVRWTEARVGDVQDYFRIKAENERLREENAELRTWMHEALTLRSQLAYYETILDTHLPAPAAYVDAAVIGENGGPYQQALILSAGRDDGVRKGSAVVDDEGLLGRIVTAGRGASRVLLLTDYESRTPVFVEGVGAEALLAGRAGGLPVLQFFAEPPADPIEVGTRVVTSGAGGLLPRGIPVGAVAARPDGTLGVALYADLGKADLVRVVDYAFPQEVEEPAAETTISASEVASLGG